MIECGWRFGICKNGRVWFLCVETVWKRDRTISRLLDQSPERWFAATWSMLKEVRIRSTGAGTGVA